MMATWAQFARIGNPNNPLVPDWPAYSAGGRPVMSLMPESMVSLNPGGAARSMLGTLPFYEYNLSRDDFWSTPAKP